MYNDDQSKEISSTSKQNTIKSSLWENMADFHTPKTVQGK